jgi:hypothetical protein
MVTKYNAQDTLASQRWMEDVKRRLTHLFQLSTAACTCSMKPVAADIRDSLGWPLRLWHDRSW